MSDVSVIILNFNGGQLTRRAILSVLKQIEVSVEVIVIDNGSTDGSWEKLVEEFKGMVRFIRNEKNLGFSPANNQGFKIASGRWIGLLNNDAEADPAWLKFSLERAGKGKRVGMVCPKIINYYERSQLDGIGVGFWLDGLTRARYRGEIDSFRFDREKVLIPSGCACLLSKDMLDELGGYDGDFFAYSEDTDLGIRAYLAGWGCEFERRAIVYHRYSKTSAERTGYSPLKLYLVERNRLWILFRYYPLYLVLAMPVTSLVRLLNQGLQAFFSRKDEVSLPFFRGILSLFKAITGAFFSIGRQLGLRRRLLFGERREAFFKEMRGYFIALKDISRLD